MIRNYTFDKAAARCGIQRNGRGVSFEWSWRVPAVGFALGFVVPIRPVKDENYDNAHQRESQNPHWMGGHEECEDYGGGYHEGSTQCLWIRIIRLRGRTRNRRWGLIGHRGAMGLAKGVQ